MYDGRLYDGKFKIELRRELQIVFLIISTFSVLGYFAIQNWLVEAGSAVGVHVIFTLTGVFLGGLVLTGVLEVPPVRNWFDRRETERRTKELFRKYIESDHLI